MSSIFNDLAVIIPARYASVRLPGKPLAPIAGRSMIERVWSIAVAAVGAQSVYVATDSEVIAEAVTAFGGNACMTSEACRNGTERVYEAAQSLARQPRVVINMQGDVPLLPPHVVRELAEAMYADAVPMATPAWQLRWDEVQAIEEVRAQGSSSGTLVTMTPECRALYFSSSIIPFVRGKREGEKSPMYRHIGMYAYTMDCLQQYVALAPSPLEEIEKLEQLRALENGIPIKVVKVDIKGRTLWSVDAPDDVVRVEALLKNEGEVL
jgi:3-deoxy-manno-octulosonate cytidylyltransferase (CMP-KDO synthetase)